MAKTYNDPAKQRSREKLREFIAKQLLTIKRPEDVKVVCFPGAEQEGEEALEIKHVYDPLGIPRQNILGLEYEHKHAERLRRANLGLEVRCQDAHDFFLETDRRFDVISLDYTGTPTMRSMHTLEAIASRQVLEKKGIVATAHLGRRENKRVQDLMAMSLSFFRTLEKTLIERDTIDMPEIGKVADNLLSENGLTTLREGTSNEMVSIFCGGTANYPIGRTFFSDNPSKKDFIKSLEGSRKIGFEEPEHIVIEKLYACFKQISYSKKMQRHLPKDLANTLLNILIASAQSSYIPRKAERYRYISNTGSPMHLDISAFAQIPETLRILTSRLVTYEPGRDPTIRLNPLCLSTNEFERLGRTLVKKYTEQYLLNLPERIDLGSSYVPPKRKERISRRDAVEMLRSGRSPAEIEENYRGFTKMGLAALKAHYITMGKELKQ